MIRKASTLETVDELNLSERALNYYDDLRADELVMRGRLDAYDSEEYDGLGVSSRELVEALKEAGFIRPASDFLSFFNVSSLFRAIYPGIGASVTIAELSNEEYEDFSSLTDEEVNSLKEKLAGQLTSREYETICWRYGLANGRCQTLLSTARHSNVSRERIRLLEAKALWKLRRAGCLFPAYLERQNGLI